MFFCNNFYSYRKGFYKGFQKGTEFNNDNNSISSYISILVSIITLLTAVYSGFYAYKSWKDNRFIERITSLNNIYYSEFLPGIGISELHLQMLKTHDELSSHDLNYLKSVIPKFTKDLELTDKNINNLNELNKEYYYNEIVKKIKKGNGGGNKIVSALHNINLINKSSHDEINDFLDDIFYVRYMFINLKRILLENNKADEKQENIQRILEYYQNNIIENMKKYENLIIKLQEEID